MPNLLVILLSSTIVTSSPGKDNIIDVMKKDTNLCNSIKVLYDSEYIKSCAALEYPTEPWDKEEKTLDKYMCLGVYDTAYKICRYSDRLSIPLNSVEEFNSSLEKFVPDNKSLKTEENKEEKYCKNNLQGFTLLYNKTELYWGPLVERLGKPHTCQRACFDFDFVFRPLCAVFAWIKAIDDEIKKLNVTNHNSATLDIPKVQVDHQDAVDHSNDKKVEIEPKETEKKTEAKESKEQLHEKIKDASSNIPNEHTQPNTEKAESGPEKWNKQETQKTLNITSSKVQDHTPREKGRESISKVEINTEVPMDPNNVPSKENVNMKDGMKGVNAEEIGKKPEEEIKASTISENTQDGAGNAEDEMGDSEGITNKNIDTHKYTLAKLILSIRNKHTKLS